MRASLRADMMALADRARELREAAEALEERYGRFMKKVARDKESEHDSSVWGVILGGLLIGTMLAVTFVGFRDRFQDELRNKDD